MAKDGDEEDKEDGEAKEAPTKGEDNDVSNKPNEFCSLFLGCDH